ncbi:BT_3987 domain-containing protein [Marinifilum sp.]|uniref:BT_3987 domain-containing protein n=1 Tax=Marinifilum sp. TaxID=2033137 RepID=UPI003BAD3339
MQYNISFKSKITSLLATCMLLFAGCDENIDVISVDEGAYETNSNSLAYVVNDAGKLSSSLFEFRNEGMASLYLSLTKTAESQVSGSFKYNSAVLDAYNNDNGTNYEAFPQELAEIMGNIEIAKGAVKSDQVMVKLTTHADLDPDKTYVLPVSAEIASGSISLSESASDYLLFVKDLTKISSTDKASGIKIISCMEVNDTNPLNNLCFTLKDSGKPFVDMVILFSANINYNAETGRVYVYNNDNVQHLLDNKEKYIKPLQDRGMKVILGILGNHDRSGIANLADETARDFAQELKAVCDAYHLDGVFFDDEYSNYQYPAPAGFVYPSTQAASRLCYETKKAMPDRLVCAYVYGRTRSLPDVEGQTSGTFVDYGIADYLQGSDLGNNYPGMPRSNMAIYSQEFARGYFASEARLDYLRSNGYGSNMIFAMDPNRSNFYRQKSAMELMATKLFDDELVYNEQPYPKDW